MDRYCLRREMTGWIAQEGYRQTATLAFNQYGVSKHYAQDRLRSLHARLDRMAIGRDWAKKPLSQRVTSISFIENPATNFHFHMLWYSPRFEDKLIAAMPGIWQTLVPAGDVKIRSIAANDSIYWYCTKQLEDDSYILSSQLCSAASNTYQMNPQPRWM